MARFASLLLLLLLIQILGPCTGCSNQSASSDGTQTSSDGGPTASRGSATSTGGGATSRGEGVVTRDAGRIQAHIRVASVRPGDEDQVCVTLDLGNAETIWANDLRASLSGGSHHLIVDRRPANSAVWTTPLPCMPTTATDDSRLMVAERAETDVVLPEGVAFRIEPHQRLFLQLHYLNTREEAHDIEGIVDLGLTAPDTAPLEAKTIFTGSLLISIDPHSPGSARSFFEPSPPGGNRQVFALTSHTHRLGVDTTIERVPSADAPPTTPIHESTNWSEAPLTVFSPPLGFDGSDGLRLVCNYQNDTDNPVAFGTATTDEMCFMWIYYFDP
ncbi:MAG TPA: hypothetical protein VF395_20030 [Polyangiaceae bacterium]